MFENETYWITGASSGIGEALAVRLAKRGAKLILSGRNINELERVAAACGGQHLVLPFDTTDFAALDGIVAAAWKWQGRVDGLINNAGISQRSLAVETPLSVYEKLVQIDLLAPIALTQAILPKMVERKAGRLIFISSIAGKVGSPMRTGYSAAKHGLIGYADALRAEVAMLGLDVHVVAPGSVRTDVSRNAITADGSSRGASDAAIEAGMDPLRFADRMLGAVERGDREIIIAAGIERQIEILRRKSRNKLFDMMAALVAKGYADSMKASKKAS